MRLLLELGLSKEFLSQIEADLDVAQIDLNAIMTSVVPAFRERFGTPVGAVSNESVAVTCDRRKVSALLYDRVWSPPLFSDGIPRDLECYGATDDEVVLQGLTIGLAIRSGWTRFTPSGEVVIEEPKHQDANSGREPGVFFQQTMRSVADSLRRQFRINAVPVYETTEARSREYKPGDGGLIISILDNLAVVSEVDLAWEQVVEFRRDESARFNYRRLVHWLDAQVVGKPVDFVVDELALRYDKYKRALGKHGLKTTIGAIQSLIDPKFLAAASATVGGVGLGIGLSAAGLAAVAVAGTQMACSIARAKIEFEEQIDGQFGEVALVHQLKELSETTG